MNHCWHATEMNNFMATYPPSREYVCCFCGVRHSIHIVKPSGHGAWLPSGEGHWEALPVTKCKLRKVTVANQGGKQ